MDGFLAVYLVSLPLFSSKKKNSRSGRAVSAGLGRRRRIATLKPCTWPVHTYETHRLHVNGPAVANAAASEAHGAECLPQLSQPWMAFSKLAIPDIISE
jgi:hypothetical protein